MGFIVNNNAWSFTVDIPEIFYASLDKKPIAHCSMCGKLLLSANEPYLIEKAFKKNLKTKNDDLVFEYALCLNCQQNALLELSKESRANIKMYFDLYVDFEKRQKVLANQENFKFTNCIKDCIITNKPIKEYGEYQIGGYFYDDQMLLASPPYAIGEKAMDEIQEVISKKTRDFLDGFKDKVIPPEVRDKVPDDFLILI